MSGQRLSAEHEKEMHESLDDCGCTKFCESWGCGSIRVLLTEIAALRFERDTARDATDCANSALDALRREKNEMVAQVDGLAGAIMNLRCSVPDEEPSDPYRSGHRDARHAAAELVLGFSRSSRGENSA
jgi:hypothetical protein